MTDREPCPQLAADKTICALEPLLGFLELFWVSAQPVKVYVRVLVIRAYARTGDRHPVQARVFDPAVDDVAQLTLDYICDSFLTSYGQETGTLSLW